MSDKIQVINLGKYANDGTGDDLRTAFEKVNANFDELKFEVTNATNLGIGAHIFAQKNATDPYLEFKTLISLDDSIIITPSETMVNLHAVARVESDPAPLLGGDLGLNGKTIKAINGGGIESRIWNIDIPVLNSVISILISSNQTSLDLGTFLKPTGRENAVVRPTGYLLDFGIFLDPLTDNNIDFGSFTQ